MKTIPKSLPQSVDDYLDRLPADTRIVLSKLRAAIKSAAPLAEEAISYGMPGYKYHGALVYFAAFKNHCSFFPGSSQIIGMYNELKSFKTAKGTIQFTNANPLPSAIVKKIVKARMKENVARQLTKQREKLSKKIVKKK